MTPDVHLIGVVYPGELDLVSRYVVTCGPRCYRGCRFIILWLIISPL